MTLDKLIRGKFLSSLLVAGTLMTSVPVYAGSSASSSASRNLQNISQAAELVLKRGSNNPYNLLLPEVRMEYGLERRLLASADERPPYLPPQYDQNGDTTPEGRDPLKKDSPSFPTRSPYTTPTERPSDTSDSSDSASKSSGVQWGWVAGGLLFAGGGFLLANVIPTYTEEVGNPIAENYGRDKYEVKKNPWEIPGYTCVVLGLAATIYGFVGGK